MHRFWLTSVGRSGGNDAAIILPSADLSKVPKQIVTSALMNSGQMCVATKRVYIHESIYDEFVAASVSALQEIIAGSPKSTETTHGPVQNKPQYDHVISLLEDCKTNGYTLKTGRAVAKDLKSGLFVQPTLIDNPPESSRIVAEEAFGESSAEGMCHPHLTNMSYLTQGRYFR